MARHLADLDCQVPPGSRAAGVAISRTRWHDKGDNPKLRVPLIPGHQVHGPGVAEICRPPVCPDRDAVTLSKTFCLQK